MVDAGVAQDVGCVHDAGTAAVDPGGRPGRVRVQAGGRGSPELLLNGCGLGVAVT